MLIGIQGDQATRFQLLSVVFEDAEDGISNNLRSGTLNTKLNDAWKPRSLQRQHAGEIQILGENDCLVSACVIKNKFIRIAVFPDI